MYILRKWTAKGVYEIVVTHKAEKILITHQAEKIWTYDRTTVRPTVQGTNFSMRRQLYHGHYLSHYVVEGRGRK